MTLPFLATATANPAAQIRAWWTSSVAWVDTHWLQIGIAMAITATLQPFLQNLYQLHLTHRFADIVIKP